VRTRGTAGPEGAVPGPLRGFAALFNAGSFWESHEVLESPWRSSRSSFYHGLILFASAFVHVQRRNAHGVGAQFRKARKALESSRPAYLGIDVEGLVALCRAGEAAVAAGMTDEAWEEWSAPQLEISPHRVRGDEIEAR
jgi:predicted metal-dependent hydrolase